MKKSELMNGDIVALRSGSIAVVIGSGDESYLMFQNSGFEFLDDYYRDDLICEDFDDAVMQVFRSTGGFGFDSVDEVQPIWERDKVWTRPFEKESAEMRFQKEMEKHEQIEDMNKSEKDQQECRIDVIAQQFYGNCTYTSICKENIDFFLKGIVNNDLFRDETVAVDRRVVRIPHFENLAIVYDQIQEDKYVQEEYPALVAQKGDHYRQRCGKEIPMQISCRIPEIGLTIHTRCFACRIDEIGNLQSLQPEDSTPVLMTFNQ